jgi:hypothetical protein
MTIRPEDHPGYGLHPFSKSDDLTPIPCYTDKVSINLPRSGLLEQDEQPDIAKGGD